MSQESNRSTFTVTDPTLILQALVSLKDVRVLDYQRDRQVVSLRIEQVLKDRACPKCGVTAWVKDRPEVAYVDLATYGKPMRLIWRKHRLWCPNRDCWKKSWLLGDHGIAAKACLLTTRAG